MQTGDPQVVILGLQEAAENEVGLGEKLRWSPHTIPHSSIIDLCLLMSFFHTLSPLPLFPSSPGSIASNPSCFLLSLGFAPLQLR